jgi:hypothetical protein
VKTLTPAINQGLAMAAPQRPAEKVGWNGS